MKLLHLCVKKIKRGSKLHWQVIGVVGLLSLWRCEKWQMDAFKKLKSNCNFKTRTNNYQHLNLSKWLIRSRTGNSFQKHFFYNCWKLPNRQWLCVSTRRKTIFSSVYLVFFYWIQCMPDPSTVYVFMWRSLCELWYSKSLVHLHKLRLHEARNGLIWSDPAKRQLKFPPVEKKIDKKEMCFCNDLI